MAKLLKVNARGQVSLGSLGQYENYYAHIDDQGRIILTPVSVTPIVRKADDQQR